VKEAVDDASVVTERPHERFTVTVEYDVRERTGGILESAGVEFEADYGEEVAFDVRVPVEEAVELRDRIARCDERPGPEETRARRMSERGANEVSDTQRPAEPGGAGSANERAGAERSRSARVCSNRERSDP